MKYITIDLNFILKWINEVNIALNRLPSHLILRQFIILEDAIKFVSLWKERTNYVDNIPDQM